MHVLGIGASNIAPIGTSNVVSLGASHIRKSAERSAKLRNVADLTLYLLKYTLRRCSARVIATEVRRFTKLHLVWFEHVSTRAIEQGKMKLNLQVALALDGAEV